MPDHILTIQSELAISLQYQECDLAVLSQSPGPDLIERLLLLMVFREGYSFNDRAVILACSNPALLQAILARAIEKLR